MSETSSIREMVQSLFETILGRQAGDAELLHYERLQRDGVSVGDIVAGIAGSEEAKHRHLAKLLDSIELSEATAHAVAQNTTTPLHVDDVMKTIAQAYELHLGRYPAFKEVHDYLTLVRQGGSLAGVLGAIAASDEARLLTERRHPQREPGERFGEVMAVIYRCCLNRTVSQPEIDSWLAEYSNGASYADILLSIDRSDEAQGLRDSRSFAQWPPGTFVQIAYERLLDRGATPSEISYYMDQIRNSRMTHEGVLAQLFLQAGGRPGTAAVIPANDPTVARLFGLKAPLTLADWEAKGCELAKQGAIGARESKGEPVFSRFLFTSSAKPLVSVITSLYEGGRFIEHFLANITSQTIFRDHCELLIIDACSPEQELEKAAGFLREFPNITYRRCDQHIGIYEAWNMGVEMARGTYCTNANVDDCRRHDSLELQASTLDALPFVDVVYQDILYSFEANLSFDEIARYGFATALPIVSRYNLMEFNCPHNGPMWRKSLHEEIGLFDATYVSAGDFDFWIRCLKQGKTFFKINDPHIAYYVNPQGLSTRGDTCGAMESGMTSKRFYPDIVSPNVTMDDVAFREKVGHLADSCAGDGDRYAIAQAALRQISIQSRQPH